MYFFNENIFSPHELAHKFLLKQWKNNVSAPLPPRYAYQRWFSWEPPLNYFASPSIFVSHPTTYVSSLKFLCLMSMRCKLLGRASQENLFLGDIYIFLTKNIIKDLFSVLKEFSKIISDMKETDIKSSSFFQVCWYWDWDLFWTTFKDWSETWGLNFYSSPSRLRLNNIILSW